MNLLSDVITYIRRIIKSPSDSEITDNLIIDYINRFWIMDVDARMQLFDLKTKYQFVTTPGVDRYNMPLYDIQVEPGAQTIASYPVYQGFLEPAFANGVRMEYYTQRELFNNAYPYFIQPFRSVAIADGGSQYTINIPFLNANPPNPPLNCWYSGLIRGHIDITGIVAIGGNIDPPSQITFNTSVPTTNVMPAVYFTTTDATGANAVVCDSGQFLKGFTNKGLLMRPGKAPFGNIGLFGGYPNTVPFLNTIDYQTGVATFNFTDDTGAALSIPDGQPINAECYYWTPGLPRAMLFYNNVITLRSIPDTQYVIELDAYLTPAAFLSSAQALTFGYMAEYLARGAARKILSDTGDIEQFQFYEPLFKEQEMLVWKRSQRQFTSTRTETIYSLGYGNGQNCYNNSGSGLT